MMLAPYRMYIESKESKKSPLRKKKTNATPPPNDSKKRSVVSRLPLSNHHQKDVKVASKAIIIGQVPTCMCML